MFLELALGNQEQHDQVNGLIVQRVEVDALLGPAKRAHHFVDQVRRSMRIPIPRPDAGAHGRFALFHTAAMASRCFGLDLPGCYQFLINSSMASHRLVACKSVMFALESECHLIHSVGISPFGHLA